MEKKLFLVANPKSGRARIKAELLQIVSVLTQGGYTVTVYPTSGPKDATRIIENLSGEYETVVCCGGDGTLNEVISGIIKNKNDYRLGYIPLGTLNEWSGGLHISKNITKAASDIITGKTMPLDIGYFDGSYFAYTASFGAFTSASYSAPQDIKNAIGQTAYVFEALKGLSSIKPVHLKFDIDGQIIEDDFLFGAVSNSLSMGGVIKLEESMVQFDDGYFEVVLIKNPLNIYEFQSIVDGIIKKDLNREQIYLLKAKNITVYGSEDTNWTLDGELGMGKPVLTIKNMNKAINFIIP